MLIEVFDLDTLEILMTIVFPSEENASEKLSAYGFGKKVGVKVDGNYSFDYEYIPPLYDGYF